MHQSSATPRRGAPIPLPPYTPGRGMLAFIKIVLFAVCLIPAVRLATALLGDNLGPNPIEELQKDLGFWTLTFLWITLAVTPLRQLTGQHWLVRLRRMLGLFAFFYGCLHFANWLGLDMGFDGELIVDDLTKRPFAILGFATLLLMLPLAATSSNRALKWLGGKRWQALHRSVYAVAILGMVHYLWGVKKVALTTPLIFAALLAVLLGYRAWDRARRFTPAGRGEPPGDMPRVVPTVTVQPVRFMERPK